MSTISNVLKVHPADNVLVALKNLEKGTVVSFEGMEYTIQEHVKAKHKLAVCDLAPGDSVTMYGVLVGKAQQPIKKGGLISTGNVKHAASDRTIQNGKKRRRDTWYRLACGLWEECERAVIPECGWH
jgi:altronate hydrolase